MIKDVSAEIKSRRRGGWEDAMRRLASFSGCLLYFGIRGLEVSDLTGGSERIKFKAVFSLNIVSGETFPKRFKLKHPDFVDADGLYFLKSRNFTAHELYRYVNTRSEACRRYLTMVAGKTLGVCDGRYTPHGYVEEIFLPVLTIPEFGSLKELNLKLDAIGA